VHQTRRELLDELLAFVNEPNDPDARNTAEGCLNRALTTLWLQLPWRVFRSPVPLQVTLTASQARYALPDYFGRVGPGRVRNLTRNGAWLRRLQDGELERCFPATGTTGETPGNPEAYELAGTCGVHTQPAVTGDALEALSDSAADVDIVVAIDGDDANGRWTRNQVTLTGVNPVALGTWSFVDECAKAYQATSTPVTEGTSSRGAVTIRKTAGQTEIQKLFAQESAKDHPVFTVFPKPVSADVLAIPVIRKPKRTFRDADPLPDLWGPAIFEQMLIDWQVNTGELTVAAAMAVPRPKFVDLAAYENQDKGRRHKQPFMNR
jgi:hypothetical protein